MVQGSAAEIPRMRERLEAALERAGSTADGWLRGIYEEKLERCNTQRITDEMSAAACSFSRSDANYDAVVAPTTSGRTVRMMARFRPDVPVLGCAHDSLTRKKLLLSFGVFPVNVGRLTEAAPAGSAPDDGSGGAEGGLLRDAQSVFGACAELLKKDGMLASGDIVVWTAGSSLFVPGTTNLIEIRRVD